MKFLRVTFTFAAVLVAVLMAFSEFPELLTLTDNVTNDYTLRIGSERPHAGVVKDSRREATAPPVVPGLPVRLRVATIANFLHSPAAKSPRGLLLLLVTQRN